jgi:glutathione S-transferase
VTAKEDALDVILYEAGTSRSARCRWTLLEAGLEYESVGNAAEVIGSDELRRIHPLGKLPAMLIDGKPLFESAAIITAVADLVPEKQLIAAPGSWSRNLHYQWISFIQSELEAFLQSTEVNSIDFIIPESEHVPEIKLQNSRFFRKGAAVLNDVLGRSDFLVDGRFSVTDIYAGYAVNWGQEQGLIDEFPNLLAFQERLFEREHCTLIRHS